MFKILFVCTGNICRSPMGEHLMREGLRERIGAEADAFVIASAGTMALVDHPIEPFAGQVMTELGIDASAFRAKKLEGFMVEGADLVLCASREHRAAAVTLVPSATRKTFTLREFDRLLSAVDAAALPDEDYGRLLIAAAASQRGLVRPDKPADDDITDPYKGPMGGYVTCASLLNSCLQRPLDMLVG